MNAVTGAAPAGASTSATRHGRRASATAQPETRSRALRILVAQATAASCGLLPCPCSSTQTSAAPSSTLVAAHSRRTEPLSASNRGQLAGAFYGESSIPGLWIKRLARADDIRQLARRLMTRE